MSTRTRLPNRREARTLRFTHNDIDYTATISHANPNDATSPIRELFIDGFKVGSATSMQAREASILLSLALQYDVPLDEISAALPKLEDGTTPAGVVGAALRAIRQPD